MAGTTSDCAAFDETIIFLSHFKDLKDPRQQAKVDYPLDEILLLCLLAVLAGAETVTDIALFGHKKRDLLRRFRPFAKGTPAHDHLDDILAVLDPEQFQHCFVAWVAALIGTPEGVIAIDGKTARRSGRKARVRRRSTWCLPSPPTSAWCSARSRWRRSPTRSLPFPSCWTCWPSRALSSPSMPWAASARSPRRWWSKRPTMCSL